MKWMFLSLGIIFEVVAMGFMKKAEGFTKLGSILCALLFFILALGCLVFVLKKMDTSIAYAIWSGGGILLMVFIGMLWLNEPVTVSKVFFIMLIAIGIFGLEYFD
jgi:small multidrug resistance pump